MSQQILVALVAFATIIRTVRSLRLILGLYVLAWFNLVVPGHTRGMLAIPGVESVRAGEACCPTHTPGEKSSRPSSDQKANCAVCFVAATYTLPPIFVFHVEPMELIQTLDQPTIAQLCSREYPAPYWPIGPPAIL